MIPPLAFRLWKYPDIREALGTRPVTSAKSIDPVSIASAAPLFRDTTDAFVPLQIDQEFQDTYVPPYPVSPQEGAYPAHHPSVLRFVAAYDFSPSSDEALRTALYLARKYGTGFDVAWTQKEQEDPDGFDRVQKIVLSLMEETPGSRPIHPVRFFPLASNLNSENAAQGLIQMGWKEPGAILVLGTDRGNFEEEVLKEAHGPVLLTKGRSLCNGVRNILLPLDGSRHATLALSQSIRFAHDFGAALMVLHVVSAQEKESQSSIFQGPFWKAVQWQNSDHELVEKKGSVVQTILACAESQDVDLIVMGTHHEEVGPLSSAHGVTVEVLRKTSCPIFVVHPFA